MCFQYKIASSKCTVNSIEHFVLIFLRKMMLTKSIDFQWKMFPWFSIQNHNFKNIAKSIEKCLWSTNTNSWKCLDRVFNTKNNSIKSIAKSIEIIISIRHINDKNPWDFNDENLWDFDDENRIDISVEKWCDQKQTDFKLKYLYWFSTQKRATISSNSSSKCTVN